MSRQQELLFFAKFLIATTLFIALVILIFLAANVTLFEDGSWTLFNTSGCIPNQLCDSEPYLGCEAIYMQDGIEIGRASIECPKVGN